MEKPSTADEKPSTAARPKSVHFDDAKAAGEWELPPIDFASQRAQAEVDLFRELGGIGVRAASAVPVADQLDRRIATAAREKLGSRELGSRGVANSARGRGGTHDVLLSRVRAMNEANAQARARAEAKRAAATPAVDQAEIDRRGVWGIAPPGKSETWKFTPPERVVVLGVDVAEPPPVMIAAHQQRLRAHHAALAAAAVPQVPAPRRAPPGPAPWLPPHGHVRRCRPAANGKWLFPEPTNSLLGRRNKAVQDHRMLSRLQALEERAALAAGRPRDPNCARVDPELGVAIPSRAARRRPPASIQERAEFAGKIMRDVREMRREIMRVVDEPWRPHLGRQR